MAHFANIDSNNIVTNVLVVSDTDAVSGQAFLNSIGLSGTWLQTSYNTRWNNHLLSGTPLRGNYAGIGHVYDPINDVFYPPQPFPSWTISADTNWMWKAPVPYPLPSNLPPSPDYPKYVWDESVINWVVVKS